MRETQLSLLAIVGALTRITRSMSKAGKRVKKRSGAWRSFNWKVCSESTKS